MMISTSHIRQMFHSLFFIAITPLISHCHSKDLGDEKPDQISIDTKVLAWDSGVGELIQKKCANCHHSARGQTVPGNTPHILNNIGDPDFFSQKKNLGLVLAIKRRIEATDVDRAMPPRFATPLYDNERSALLEYIDNAIKELSAAPKEIPTQSPATPQPSSDPAPNVSRDSDKKTFNDVQSIFIAACSGCHDGEYQFALKNAEDLTPTIKKRALKALKSGTMPEDDNTFKDSPNGKVLIEWLSQ